MKKTITIFTTILIFFSSGNSQTTEKEQLNQLLDNWHQAAANADQQSYFDFIADDGIYIGTDATENWTKDEFFEWSKSNFENGKAWSFVAKERNIYLSKKSTIAWFDEQLEYPGGVLRGSGVLAKEKNNWKLKHYVLSLPVPNESFKEVVEVINQKTPEKEKEE